MAAAPCDVQRYVNVLRQAIYEAEIPINQRPFLPDIQSLQNEICLQQLRAQFYNVLESTDKKWIPKGYLKDVVRACVNGQCNKSDNVTIDFYRLGGINAVIALYLAAKDNKWVFGEIAALPEELRKVLIIDVKEIKINDYIPVWILDCDRSPIPDNAPIPCLDRFAPTKKPPEARQKRPRYRKTSPSLPAKNASITIVPTVVSTLHRPQNQQGTLERGSDSRVLISNIINHAPPLSESASSHSAHNPCGTPRREHEVLENASLQGIKDVFDEYMCDAIRRDTVQSGDTHCLKAAITMDFPLTGLVDCLMSLAIHPSKVEYLAMALFNVQVESVGHFRYAALSGGVRLILNSEITLKGVSDEAVIRVFGRQIHEAIRKSGIRKKELEAGNNVTEGVSMILTSGCREGAVINLSLDVKGGTEIQRKLYT